MESPSSQRSQNAKRPLSASLPLYKGIPPALQQKIDHYRNNPDAVAQLHQRIAAFNSSNKQGAGAATTNSRTCTRSSSSAAAAAACSTDHVQQNAENVTPWPAIGGLSNLRGLVVDVELDVHGSSPSTNEGVPAGGLSSPQQWQHNRHAGATSCISSPAPLSRPQSPGRTQQQQQQQQQQGASSCDIHLQARTPRALQDCSSAQGMPRPCRPASATPGVLGPSKQHGVAFGAPIAAAGAAPRRPASACAASGAGHPGRPGSLQPAAGALWGSRAAGSVLSGHSSVCAGAAGGTGPRPCSSPPRQCRPGSPTTAPARQSASPQRSAAAVAAAAATATAYQLLYAGPQRTASRPTSRARSRPASAATGRRAHSPQGARPASTVARMQQQGATATCSRPSSAATATLGRQSPNRAEDSTGRHGRAEHSALEDEEVGVTRPWASRSPPRSRPGTAAASGSWEHGQRQSGRQRPQSAAAAYQSGRVRMEQTSDGEGWYEDDGSSDEDHDGFNHGIRLQLAEQLLTRKAARQQHSAAVSHRRQEVLAAAERRRETLRHKEALKAAAKEAAARQAAWQELQEERFQALGGIVRTITIVQACAAAVRAAREERRQQEQRKAAACLIATTYKRYLLRQRQRELALLVVKVHKLMQPYIARMLIAARRRAARRMVHFLQLTQTSSPVAVAVAHFTRRVLFIQRHWRAMLAIRAAQQQLLYNQLLQLEEKVVRRNTTQAAAIAAASTPRGRATTAAGGAEGRMARGTMAGGWSTGEGAGTISGSLTNRSRGSVAGAAESPGAGDVKDSSSASSRPGSAAKQRPSTAATTSSSSERSGPKAVFKPGGKGGRPLSAPTKAVLPAKPTVAQVAVHAVEAGREAPAAVGVRKAGAAGVMQKLAAAEAAAQQFAAEQAHAQQPLPGAPSHAPMVCSMASAAIAAEEAAGIVGSSSPPASPGKKRLTVMIPPAEDAGGDTARHDAPPSPSLRLPAKTPRIAALAVPATPSAAAGFGGSGCSSPKAGGKGQGRSPRSPRGKRVGVNVDGCDLEIEARLRDLMELLPHEIRQQVAHQALLAERHKLLVLKDQYASALRRYTAALPIENVRLQLLKDAGLPATSKLQMPKRPRMALIMPQAALKELVVAGMDLLYQRTVGWGAATAAAAQAEAGIPALPATGAATVAPRPR